MCMIEFYFGLPGEGKSFCVTKIVMDRLKKGRRVFSNYPIFFRDRGKQYSSFVWDDKYVYEPLNECDIVIDEGYRTASSRDWKSFSVDEHTFYGTTGHNGIDVFFITQAIPRIEVIIRELTAKFHLIKKFAIPWFRPDPRGYYEKVIWFTDEVYLQDAKTAGTPGAEVYTKSRIMFDKHTSKAYDTKYYRKKGELSFTPQLWTEKLNITDKQAVEKGFFEFISKLKKGTSNHTQPAVIGQQNQSAGVNIEYLFEELPKVARRDDLDWID